MSRPTGETTTTMTFDHLEKLLTKVYLQGFDYAFTSGMAADETTTQDKARSAKATLAADAQSRAAILANFPNAFRLASNGGRPVAADAAPSQTGRPDFPNANRLARG